MHQLIRNCKVYILLSLFFIIKCNHTYNTCIFKHMDVKASKNYFLVLKMFHSQRLVKNQVGKLQNSGIQVIRAEYVLLLNYTSMYVQCGISPLSLPQIKVTGPHRLHRITMYIHFSLAGRMLIKKLLSQYLKNQFASIQT